jgi:putative DNA-invertase from lambdoid prophage Rac
MPVYGYCRVSTLAQANEGESLDVQRRQLEGWAHMQGQTLDDVFVERGVSGSIPLSDRPEGGKLWARLRKGDTVVASKLDRVFRSALDALQVVEELRRRGVSLVLIDLGGDVTGNGMSRMFMTVAAAFAEAERDRIRERIVTVKRDQKERGRYLGGKAPYGFRLVKVGEGKETVLEPIPEQQAIIRRVQELRAAGATLRAIQATLADEHGERVSLDALSRLVKEAA